MKSARIGKPAKIGFPPFHGGNVRRTKGARGGRVTPRPLWIPAFAGMTGVLQWSRHHRNDDGFVTISNLGEDHEDY